jgi:sugar/nucleoside kinase (ribokinase family)
VTRRGIICGGSIVVDVNKVIDRLPPPEELAVILSQAIDTGGPGLNMAVDLARLGCGFPVALVGLIGDDAHGRHVRDTCAAVGIDTGGLGVVAGVPTSFTDVMIERATGRRTFFHCQGANALLKPDRFDFAGTNARILHVGAPGVHERMDAPSPGGNGFAEVLARASAAGLRTNLELVCVEPERIRALATPCLPHLDTIIINELEAAAITGREDPPDAAKELVRLGVRDLAVVHFPAGCVAAAADGRTWRQAAVRMPKAEIRSTNGAGDAFAAGVMLGLHEGMPVERCLVQGVCVAAVSLTALGPSAGIRPLAACLAFGEQHGFGSP